MNLDIQKNEGLKEHKKSIFKKVFHLISSIKKSELANSEISDTKKLIDSITKAKREWTKAYNDFNHAVDNDMIDYHAYKIKAYQAKYEYLIRIAKEKGIKFENKASSKK